MNTIQLSQDQYQDLVDRIANIEKIIAEKFQDYQPPVKEGSPQWWKKELREAEHEYRTGQGKEFKTGEDLVAYLNTITNEDNTSAKS